LKKKLKNRRIIEGKVSKGLWKLEYFTMQKYNLQENHLKETKTLQDITTL
jgi:hypothetical protein